MQPQQQPLPDGRSARAVPMRGYAAEWAAMRRAHDRRTGPRSADEFAQLLRRRTQHGAQDGHEDGECDTKEGEVDGDDRGDSTVLLQQQQRRSASSSWYACALHLVCVCLCARNPQRARRRLQRLYWHGWSQLTHGVLLACGGTLLLLLAVLCALYTGERARVAALLFTALLLCVPGYYSVFTLLMYVRGHAGYSYTQLP